MHPGKHNLWRLAKTKVNILTEIMVSVITSNPALILISIFEFESSSMYSLCYIKSELLLKKMSSSLQYFDLSLKAREGKET